MKKICLVDNREFKTSRASSNYCSRDCYYESKRGKPSPVKGRGLRHKLCPICNKDFIVGGRNNPSAKAIYCSRSCSNKSRARQDKCLECDNLLKSTQKKYCSRDCYYLVNSRRIKIKFQKFNCDRCGKEFERYISTRRGKKNYCSGECRDKGRVYKAGKDHPNWSGGTYINNGYLYEIDPRRVRGLSGNYKHRAVHVRIMEEFLDRPLNEKEHVHHLNLDKLDNSLENLLVMTNNEHRALHSFYESEFRREHSEKRDLRQLSIEFLKKYRTD